MYILQVSGVIFISGDVHFGEISRYDCGLSYPVYDITSSGITQGVEELAAAPFSYILPLAAWIMPNSMRVFNSRCRYRVMHIWCGFSLLSDPSYMPNVM